MKSITFEINPAGNVKTTDSCGWGDQCTEATKAVEAKLGIADEGSRQLTEKFYERENTNQAENYSS